MAHSWQLMFLFRLQNYCFSATRPNLYPPKNAHKIQIVNSHLAKRLIRSPSQMFLGLMHSPWQTMAYSVSDAVANARGHMPACRVPRPSRL